MRSLNILLLLLLLHLSSCEDLFLYNPNEIRLEESEKNLNRKNIDLITSQPPSGTVRFVVTGDSQRFYEDLEDLVKAVNAIDNISFVVLNGDISDFGLGTEFLLVNKILRKLNVPYLGVIGNHDMLANGRLVYNEMFGPENFSFSHGPNKFIFMNTNAIETGYDGTVPDLDWLQQQLSANNADKVFVFSHIPPFDEGFDQSKELPYANLLATTGNVELSIHGHLHTYFFGQPYDDGVSYLISSSVDKRSFEIVTVTNDNYEVEKVLY